MKISNSDARQLALSYLVRHQLSEEHAGMVADHLVYATQAGHDFAGLSRLPPIAEQLRLRGTGGTIKTLRETERSAVMDGANVIGYVTSLIAMDKAISLAKTGGVGIVGLNNSWFSGMLRFYVERAADAGLIGLHTSNTTARVAPYGGIDRLLGTNPLAFACPADGGPLVVDIGTSSIMWGDVILHQQTSKPLPEGRAVDPEGNPTVDPGLALAGAMNAWGGPKGSAISVIAQTLGILAGSDPIIGDSGKWGYFFLVIDPGLLMPLAEFKSKVGNMRAQIEGSRPTPGGSLVRAPGTSGSKRLEEARARGWIEIDEAVYRVVS